eukprot:8994161-Ditylum_brightwellii.AAC.1
MPVKVLTKTSKGRMPGNLVLSALGSHWTAAGAGARPNGSTTCLSHSKLVSQQRLWSHILEWWRHSKK